MHERLPPVRIEQDVRHRSLILPRRQRSALSAELRSLERELGRWNTELRDVAAQVSPSGDDSPWVARLADLQDRLRTGERRATEVREQLRGIEGRSIGYGDVADALSRFDPIWEALTPREQARVIELLVERVDYDGERGKVAVTFHPHGIKSFAEEFTDNEDAA